MGCAKGVLTNQSLRLRKGSARRKAASEARTRSSAATDLYFFTRREARGELRDCGDRRKDIGVPEVLPAVLGTNGHAGTSTNGGPVPEACAAAWSGDVRLEGQRLNLPSRGD